MKHNTINCYIDGKKSALANINDVIYFLSHTQKYDNARLDNMLGWKYAYKVTAAAVPGENVCNYDAQFVQAMLQAYTPIPAQSVILEGTPEYEAIRANIRRCPGRTRRGKSEQEPAPQPVPAPEQEPAPVPEQKPEPVPAPVPVPAQKPAGEVVHDRYDKIMNILKGGEAVYLFGPAGSGKNHVCEQIARALGVEFYYQNSITDEYKLTGFIDGAGRYHETEFYRAFTRGGVFMLDELDASCADTLVTLNAAIANGYYPFPTGREKMHPDFHCIAAGNTCGRGATEEYTGRTVLDASTLNRFMPMKFDYCPAIEKKLAGPNGADILEFIRDLRKSAAAAGVHIVLGYRNIQRLAKFRGVFNTRELVEFCITGGYDRDEINILKAGLTHKDNIFAAAM